VIGGEARRVDLWRLQLSVRDLSPRYTRRLILRHTGAVPHLKLHHATGCQLCRASPRSGQLTSSNVNGFPGAPRMVSLTGAFSPGVSSHLRVVPQTLAGRGRQSGGISGISNLYRHQICTSTWTVRPTIYQAGPRVDPAKIQSRQVFHRAISPDHPLARETDFDPTAAPFLTDHPS
jgi:hypothetical protein